MTIGEALKQIRGELCLTQKQMLLQKPPLQPVSVPFVVFLCHTITSEK